jgi:hypothetical protein
LVGGLSKSLSMRICSSVSVGTRCLFVSGCGGRTRIGEYCYHLYISPSRLPFPLISYFLDFLNIILLRTPQNSAFRLSAIWVRSPHGLGTKASNITYTKETSVFKPSHFVYPSFLLPASPITSPSHPSQRCLKSFD